MTKKEERYALITIVIAIFGIAIPLIYAEVTKSRDDDISDCEKNEKSLIEEIQKVRDDIVSLNPLEITHLKLKEQCNEIQKLNNLITLNSKCPYNQIWQPELNEFHKITHKKVENLIKDWTQMSSKRNNKSTPTDLHYVSTILYLSSTILNFCEQNQNICDEKINTAFQNVLKICKNRGYVPDDF